MVVLVHTMSKGIFLKQVNAIQKYCQLVFSLNDVSLQKYNREASWISMNCDFSSSDKLIQSSARAVKVVEVVHTNQMFL